MKYTITEMYVASDGESVMLSLDVTPGHDGTREDAERMAREYFEVYGYRVVESAKATGHWPLPPDHPNAPRNA